MKPIKFCASLGLALAFSLPAMANEVFVVQSTTNGGDFTAVPNAATVVGLSALGGTGKGKVVLKDGGNDVARQMTFFTPSGAAMDFHIPEPGLDFRSNVTIELDDVSDVTVIVR